MGEMDAHHWDMAKLHKVSKSPAKVLTVSWPSVAPDIFQHLSSSLLWRSFRNDGIETVSGP